MSQKLNFAGYSVEMGECADDSRIRLNVSGNLPALLNASIPAAQALHDRLEREIAEALAVETPASREFTRCQAEAARIEGELSAIAQREQSAPLELDRAIESGDLDGAERSQHEISQLPLRKKIAKKSERYARENLACARAALDTERTEITQRIRDAKAAELKKTVERAERKLAAVIAETLPAFLEGESLVTAAREGWTPTGRGYILSRAEIAAAEERRADAALARVEAGRRASEASQLAELERFRRAEAAESSTLGRFWAGVMGW